MGARRFHDDARVPRPIYEKGNLAGSLVSHGVIVTWRTQEVISSHGLGMESLELPSTRGAAFWIGYSWPGSKRLLGRTWKVLVPVVLRSLCMCL